MCSDSGSGGTPSCCGEELYGSVFLDVVSGTAVWSPELPLRAQQASPSPWTPLSNHWTPGQRQQQPVRTCKQ